MNRPFASPRLALSGLLLSLGAFATVGGGAGCGRSSLLDDGAGPNGCPAGQVRDISGQCVPVNGLPDFSQGGPGDDGSIGPGSDGFVGPGDDGFIGPQDDGFIGPGQPDLVVPGKGDMGGTCSQKIEICDNHIDDNCNGLIDCADPQCAGDTHCTKTGHEICNNGIDDDNNGLTDCADPACKTFPACQVHACDPNKVDCADPLCNMVPQCQDLVCHPTVDFGGLAHNDASSTKTVTTVGTKDVAITPCAPGGAGMVVTEFTVLTDATAVKLDFLQMPGGDHVFGLFRAGVLQKCDANPLDCYDPKSNSSGSHTWVLNKGRYYLIVQPYTKQHQGSVSVTLSTPPTAKKEICDNGVDDDGNGLIDCADPACFADPLCNKKECLPDITVGTLVLNDPPKHAAFTTQGGKSRYKLSCAGGGGDDMAVQFTIKETEGVLMDWNQSGDHVVELFQKPGPGENCDAHSLGCYDPSGRKQDLVAWGELPAGDYIFVFQSVKPGKEGHVDVRLSAYRNRKIELCHNGIDDDANGLTDCADPACFTDPGCGPPVCQPDVDLGVLVRNGPGKSVTLDLKGGAPNEIVSCAKGGGKTRVVQATLTENGGMGFQCQDQGGDAVLGLFAQEGPRDACDKLELACGDPKVIPFGCNYEIPNLQPGTYYILAQAFAAGQEGIVHLTLSAIEDRALEICNNGIDDDKDGFTDCADHKCATSPYCIPKACKPVETIDPLPTNGKAVFKLVQTFGTQVTVQPPCEVKPGGGNVTLLVNLPGKATLTVGYAQLGQHVLALYPYPGAGVTCDAQKVLQCDATTAMNGSGTVTYKNLPGGKYYLVVAADQPGDEGSISLKISAVP